MKSKNGIIETIGKRITNNWKSGDQWNQGFTRQEQKETDGVNAATIEVKAVTKTIPNIL